jgi:transcriptional regulator with XRE-family HTH domain
MPISGSTVVRRQLGRRLRRLRDAAGKTERDVEEAGLASRVKLWRIEAGKTAVRIADVRTLCWLYGADQATTDALAALAAGTSAQGWWEDYGVPGWFGLYVGLEAAASEIRIYDPELVHGLLQTPNYLRALFVDSGVEIDEEAIQRQIKIRQERQQAITIRTPPAKVIAILGAGVLARRVGGDAVMTEQIARLKELNQLGHLDIRIMPWEVGGHAAQHIGAFTILDFADPNDPPVVYLESHTGARYLEKEDELAEYRKIYELIYKKTVPIEEYSDDYTVEKVKQVRNKRRPVR